MSRIGSVGVFAVCWALLASDSHAEPPTLSVEVAVTDPPARHRAKRSPRPAVPVALLDEDIEIDGRLDEPAWRSAEAAPPLGPRQLGPAPPETSLRVLSTPAGLALGVQGLAPELESEWLLDPLGALQEWHRLALHGDQVTWERCGLGGVPLPVEANLSEKAARCAAAASPMAAERGPGGAWELLIPWESMGPLSSQASLSWRVHGEERVGGTWAAGGAESFSPRGALRLELGVPRGTLAVRQDLERARWTLVLGLPDDAPEGPWSWSLRVRGGVVASGELPGRPGGSSEVEVPARDLRGGRVVALGAGAGPVSPGAVGVVPRFQREATLVTPVYADVIELAWAVSGRMPGLRVRVDDPQGMALGEALVDLPRGEGFLRIHARPEWGRVRISVSSLAEDLPAVRAEGG